ncbi:MULTISPECIES: alpha/beta hydrolase [Mycolicibacterium]|uniref:Esterase n=1 Tax=Mycolicibacterium fortuitum TaxID=1766 RepID=A0ABD6QTR8_MYCFO|nr:MULTISPECIES: alpha/beta hydrolase fold domain-containing protein [Mycolicibacterium]OBA92356.1 esterase [Mycolicibacterium fortuitum]OBI64258.1 esterase [Mycolicibacterium fortuitum]OMC52412.1 esterase [Mycolicibacterium fortuitum]UBV15513.1 alpha/beta hydrolase fold domain-containing protein [Mycolicibacterium fortuitum]
MIAMTGAYAAKRVLHRRRSLEAAALGVGCRLAVKNAVRVWALQPDLAWPLSSIDRVVGLVPHRVAASVRPLSLPNCPAELVHAPGASAHNAILYLHGGAFLTCGLNTHRALAARLSAAADALVLNVGYRMLPVCGLADAVEDALAGLSWLRRQGFGAERTVIAGDSAGGYLAFGTALRSMADGVVPAAGLAAISPLIDLDPAQKLAHRNVSRCSMFTGAALSAFARCVRRSQCEPDRCGAEPLIDPATADLTGMPPAMIHVGADELLLADSELMARRLADARASCELHVWSGQIHDFPLAAEILPEGRRAIGYIGDFVKGVTAAPAQSVA